jgi:hypothetical protein
VHLRNSLFFRYLRPIGENNFQPLSRVEREPPQGVVRRQAVCLHRLHVQPDGQLCLQDAGSSLNCEKNLKDVKILAENRHTIHLS